MTPDTLPTPALLADFNLDWPDSGLSCALYGGGFVLAFVLAVVVYIRDTRRLSFVASAWLMLLRLAVLAALVVIALNPHDRTARTLYRPSQVMLLVDTSVSMSFPEKSARAGTTTASGERTRIQAIIDALSRSAVVERLREQHEVAVYTFDEKLRGPHHVFRSRLDPDAAPPPGPTADQAAAKEQPAKLDWKKLLAAEGNETRLGESLLQLMRDKKSSTLAGIVVFSDGQSNAGVTPPSANAFARKNGVRLIAVGIGGTVRPVNLRVADVQAPSDVNKGDAYEIAAFVHGAGLEGRRIQVKLFVKPEEAGDEALEEVRGAVVDGDDDEPLALPDDGSLVERKWKLNPKEIGAYQYVVRAQPAFAVEEFREDDNEARRAVNVVERNLGVLIIAGGPMRDYRFAHTMLHRHENFDVDVWLQTVDPRTAGHVSQDADDLLTVWPASFPTRPLAASGQIPPGSTHARQYDVIIAFDPLWREPPAAAKRIPPARPLPVEAAEQINEWVAKQAGGAIFVAGDVHTPLLAEADDLDEIRDLYPVFLDRDPLGSLDEERALRPWKLAVTREGLGAAFLQLGETAVESAELWQEFDGVYRSYPTRGPKGGAIVYAYFSDPGYLGGEFGPPILIASQFYGAGRTLYVGSPELWRLRALDEAYFERFWIKAVREVGQGRLSRQSAYGTVMLERGNYSLGQTVRVRAHLLDAQNREITNAQARMEVVTPSGAPLDPPHPLRLEENRPGHYISSFRAGEKGRYEIRVFNPAVEDEVLTEQIIVELPDLESARPEQDARLLADLARDTGGRYLRLEEFEQVVAEIGRLEDRLEELRESQPPSPSTEKLEEQLGEARENLERLLPNRSSSVVVDERLRTLWDRDVVLFLIVALLSVEWLTRKLLKLA